MTAIKKLGSLRWELRQDCVDIIMAGGLFRTFAVVFGPTMLNVIAADSATYTFFYTTLYEAAFYFLPIYLGYACAKKLGASPVLGLLCGGVLIAPSIISAAATGGSGVISIYGISIAASNYSQTVLPIVLTIPVLYVVEKWMKKHVPDVLSTMFVPFFSMIVIIPIEFIVLAPIGNLIGTGIANVLFGLSDLGGVGILVVMAILGAFWQLFVIAGMHLITTYGGWRSRRLVGFYERLVRVLFTRYKGLVHYWLTFNEINMILALPFMFLTVPMEAEEAS